MKLHCLCESCGHDNYKSLTSPFSFKYGSTVHIPCFECLNCKERYAVVPSKLSIAIEQIICFVIPIILMIVFLTIYPHPKDSPERKIEIIVIIVLGTLILYGVLITLWNYLKSFLGLKPLSYILIHIDNEYVEITHKQEEIDFIAVTDFVKKAITNIQEGTVYLCKVGSDIGAVKLIKFNLYNEKIELSLKNVNLNKAYNNTEFILFSPKGKELCRGKINSCQD